MWPIAAIVRGRIARNPHVATLPGASWQHVSLSAQAVCAGITVSMALSLSSYFALTSRPEWVDALLGSVGLMALGVFCISRVLNEATKVAFLLRGACRGTLTPA